MINIKQETLISKEKKDKSDFNNIITDKKQVNIVNKNCKSLINTEQFNKKANKLLSRWSGIQINSLEDCKKLRNEMNELVSTFIYIKLDNRGNM